MATADLKFDVSALDRASSTFTRLGRAVERFEKKLDELDGKKVRAEAEVEAKTDKAEREIGAFARDMQRRISAAVKALPEIELNADSSEADRELARVRAELDALSRKTVGVDIDAAAADAELRRLNDELKRLGAASANVQVQADTAAAVAALRVVDAEVDHLDGRTARVKVDIDRSLGETLIHVTRLAGALRTLAIPASIAAAAPQLASLGAAAVTASGALYLIPAAGAAAGATIGALVVGLHGFGDALKSSGDPKKFAEALKALAPNAQQAATAVRDLGKSWHEVQQATQQALFAGAAQEIRDLGGTYLPILRTGLTSVATALSGAGKELATFLSTARTTSSVATIFENTAKATKALAPGLVSVGAILRDIATVGSSFLPRLAEGFSRAAERAADFIAKARDSGQLAAWIQRGIDTLTQLGRIAANVGSALGSIFDAAKTSGADFLGTVERITQGIADFLRSANGQAALVSLFREIRAAVDALAPGLQALATAVADVVQKLANAGVLSGAASALSSIAQAAAPVLQILGSLASTVLPPLLSAASALAPVLVPIAAGLLAIRAAAAGFAAVSGLFARFGTSVGVALVNVGAFSERLGASSATVDRFAAAGVKAESVISKMGKALPVVGAALIGLDALYQALTPDTDQWAQSVLNGSTSIAQLNQQIQDHNRTAAGLLGVASLIPGVYNLVAGSVDDVRAKMQEQIATMGPLEAATARVKVAQLDYDQAVRQFGPNSAQAASAQQSLASAVDAAEAAQRRAANAAKSYADQLRDQVAAAESVLSANLALDDALARVADAEKAANDAARQHGAASKEAAAANRDLVQAVDQAAQAAQRKAEADAQAAGASNAADVGAAAYASTLLNQAATLNGPARQAVLAYLGTLGQAQLDALSAASAASGFATQVLQLPGGKTVTIAVDPQTGKIVDTKTLLDSIENKTVVVDGDTTPFETKVRDGVGAALDGAASRATVPVDADTAPATAKITQLVPLANGLTGKVVIDANPDPATGKINGVVSYAGVQIGTIQLDANQAPVNGKVQATVTYIDGTTATMQLDANPLLAQGKLNGFEAQANASHTQGTHDISIAPAQGSLGAFASVANASFTKGTHDTNIAPAQGSLGAFASTANSTRTRSTHDADTSAAVAKINELKRPTSSTHTVYIRTVGSVGASGSASGSAGARALGAYTTPAAYASGGLRRLSAGRAEIVPPRQPRIIGDRMQGDEAFIPINKSPRSQAILRMAANRMGWDLVGRMPPAMRSSGGLAPVPVIPPVRPSRGPDLGPLMSLLRQVTAAAGGSADLGRRIDDLVDAVRAARPITVNALPENVVETARATQLALRIA